MTISNPISDAAILARILRMRSPDRASWLIEEHGSLGRVLAKARGRDGALRGVSEPEAETLAYVAEALTRVTTEDLSAKPIVMGTWDTVLAWARANIGHEEREHFVLLTLDRKNALIRSRTISVGTVDQAPVYPREVARMALMDNASAVILIHNHPSGDTTPSRADIDMTRDVTKALATLGMSVHDHFVITSRGHVSLRSAGLM